jgi:asparagine synthase (glutamine-hydrolysing)
MLEGAHGRTLIVGHAGRELLNFWRGRRLCDLLAGRQRPDRSALADAAIAAAPRRLRALRRRRTIEPPAWLTAEARTEFIRKRADELAGEPLFWTQAVARAPVKRCLRATWQNFAKLAEDHSVTVETPYGSPEFLGALARAGGRFGWGGRDEFFRHFDSRILPPPQRTSRPAPTAPQPAGSDPFWGPAARGFAENWDGWGIDPALVDPEALRRAWLDGHHQAAQLLHAAWLEKSAAAQPAV